MWRTTQGQYANDVFHIWLLNFRKSLCPWVFVQYIITQSKYISYIRFKLNKEKQNKQYKEKYKNVEQAVFNRQ